MNRYETSLHLFQSPRYQTISGEWFNTFSEAVVNSPCNEFSWDEAAISSIISFSYICGNRTLLKEIKRQPWLSDIGSDNYPNLKLIPPHDTRYIPSKKTALVLEELLSQEAIRVCKSAKRIYILLSGGLDSRIVAGILANLYHKKIIKARPVALTWGKPNSRDVVYGNLVANILNLDFKNIEILPEHLMGNIDTVSQILGGAISPIHLHRMTWFKDIPDDAVVLNGSYGDSVGRAEFQSKHLLDLDLLYPRDNYGLLKNEVLLVGKNNLNKDLVEFRGRTKNVPKYILCEHEMQAHYMRGLIAEAMSVINSYCTVYHMFTDPAVYSFVWSIHPAFRNNAIYAELLKIIDPKLAELPWARTNSSLRGKTTHARNDLDKDFHDYNKWLGGILYQSICKSVDESWFSNTGLFDENKLTQFVKLAKTNPLEFRYDLFSWLPCLQKLDQHINKFGKTILSVAETGITKAKIYESAKIVPKGNLWIALRNKKRLYRFVTRIRVNIKRVFALIKYPVHK